LKKNILWLSFLSSSHFSREPVNHSSYSTLAPKTTHVQFFFIWNVFGTANHVDAVVALIVVVVFDCALNHQEFFCIRFFQEFLIHLNALN